MHVNVQKSTRTTCPRSSAGPSGSELSHVVAPSSEGMCRRRRSNTLISEDLCSGAGRAVEGTARRLVASPARRTRREPWSAPWSRGRSAAGGPRAPSGADSGLPWVRGLGERAPGLRLVDGRAVTVSGHRYRVIRADVLPLVTSPVQAGEPRGTGRRTRAFHGCEGPPDSATFRWRDPVRKEPA